MKSTGFDLYTCIENFGNCKTTMINRQQVRPNRRKTKNHKHTSNNWWKVPPRHAA